jgi:hypothetical protein
MHYMLLLYLPERPEPETPEGEKMFGAVREFVEVCRSRGALVAAGPLQGPDSATTVRVREDETLLTDGPFAETREWLAGYFLLDCRDLDEALELAAVCPTARDGSVEVRPMMAPLGVQA